VEAVPGEVLPTKTWTEVRQAWRAQRDARRRRQQLRRELLEFRTPAERDELQAILARYDTTVADLLAGREPRITVPEPPTDADWERLWDEIVLGLTADGDNPDEQ
jgi:hypothetical protein